MSYENPDNLQTVADALGLVVKKSALFTKEKGDGVASDEKIRNVAFSEEIFKFIALFILIWRSKAFNEKFD